MKKLLFFIIISVPGVNQLNAQLQITNGAELSMTANALLTLQDVNLINDGIFNQTAGTVRFTGNTNTSISGSQAVQFYNLELAKGTNNQLSLLRNINAGNQISFTGGYIDLNGFNIVLSTAALLVGERDSSRIRSTSGGYIEITNTLNNPSLNNPGNLGAIFTTAVNMGSTRIRRGHQSQLNGYGQGSSILRYYDITPTTNNGLNATLRFQYFDAELNGLTENVLTLWKSINTTNWTDQNFTTRDITSNYVEKNGIADFSRWTLSTPGNPLPVKFLLFNTKCDMDKVNLHWKTAYEQNSSHFEVQRSGDGFSWLAIGSIPAAGYSSGESSYSFLDLSPFSSNAFYRIAEFDIDGKSQYTAVIRNKCGLEENMDCWPNPAVDQIYVLITAVNNSKAVISMYDAKGSLVNKQQHALLTGNNQVSFNTRQLASGIYYVQAIWNDGQVTKTIRVIKQ